MGFNSGFKGLSVTVVSRGVAAYRSSVPTSKKTKWITKKKTIGYCCL